MPQLSRALGGEPGALNVNPEIGLPGLWSRDHSGRVDDRGWGGQSSPGLGFLDRSPDGDRSLAGHLCGAFLRAHQCCDCVSRSAEALENVAPQESSAAGQENHHDSRSLSIRAQYSVLSTQYSVLSTQYSVLVS